MGMTATDELRRMLDERGVEHEGGERSLRWRDRYGVMMQAFPLADGELGMEVWSCTPEQAIAATLDAEHDVSLAWDRVRKAEAEADRLREEIHWLKKGDILHVLTDQEYIDQCERERLMQVSIDALDKENAKLRELVWRLLEVERIGATSAEWHELLERASELRVEVDA